MAANCQLKGVYSYGDSPRIALDSLFIQINLKPDMLQSY